MLRASRLVVDIIRLVVYNRHCQEGHGHRTALRVRSHAGQLHGPHTWRHIAHGPPDTHTERRAYSLGGTYTADAFRAFTPVNGIQYFVSDTEYQEYITDNDTEHADRAQ